MKNIFICFVFITYLFANNIENIIHNIDENISINNNVNKIFPNDTYQKEIEKIKNTYSNNKKVKTLFYLYSSSMDSNAVASFFTLSNKLKDMDYQSYAILRGFPSNGMMAHQLEIRDLNITSGTTKIQPFIFKEFNIKKVPAFVLSECDSDFRFKSCKHLFIARGDITLIDFFNLISNSDKTYKKEYFKLIEAN